MHSVATQRTTGTFHVTCADCGTRNNCACLSPFRLLREMTQLVRQLLAGTTDLGERRRIRARLALLADRQGQRIREENFIYGGRLKEAETEFLDHLVTDWQGDVDIDRSVRGIAKGRVTAKHGERLLRRFLRVTRPRAARPTVRVQVTTACRRAA